MDSTPAVGSCVLRAPPRAKRPEQNGTVSTRNGFVLSQGKLAACRPGEWQTGYLPHLVVMHCVCLKKSRDRRSGRSKKLEV